MMDLYLKRNANDGSMFDIMTKDAYGWTVWATVHEDFIQSETIMMLAIGRDLDNGETVKLRVEYKETLPS